MSSSLSSPQDVVEWLSQTSQQEKRTWLFYHADPDGCVSAAYWAIILSKAGFQVIPRKVRTSELGFEIVEDNLRQGDIKCAVFLDIPAGTQFERWYDSLPKELRIFVYDHHDLGRQIVNFPPRFLQYATENIAKLPPTCLFSHQIYTAFLKSEPTWLVYVGLLGEGQISRYSEYVIDWSFAKELVTLVAHGVLRDDNLVLEYLVSHLSAGAQPPAPMFNDKMVELRKTSTQVSRAIREATEKVLLNGDETIIVRLVSSEYQIANYVSSKARHSRPDSLIVVGEHISNGTICADLRTGRRLKIDLRPIINEAKQSGLLLGGGGHPAAVGVRLKADKWQPFIDFLKGKIS